MRTRPLTVRKRTHGSLHSIIVVTLFLVLGLFVNEEYLTKKPHTDQPVAPSNDEIYTGSILFTPHEGSTCHQFLFDNRTGRFNDNGNVDCDVPKA
jgi:hypothetical protein